MTFDDVTAEITVNFDLVTSDNAAAAADDRLVLSDYELAKLQVSERE